MSMVLLSISSLPVGHCHLVYRQASSHLSWPALPEVYGSLTKTQVKASNASLPSYKLSFPLNGDICLSPTLLSSE